MGMTLIPKSFSRARTRACEALRAPLVSALERPTRSPNVVYSCEGVGMQVQAASVPAAIRTLLFVVVVEAAGGGYSFCC